MVILNPLDQHAEAQATQPLLTVGAPPTTKSNGVKLPPLRSESALTRMLDNLAGRLSAAPSARQPAPQPASIPLSERLAAFQAEHAAAPSAAEPQSETDRFIAMGKALGGRVDVESPIPPLKPGPMEPPEEDRFIIERQPVVPADVGDRPERGRFEKAPTPEEPKKLATRPDGIARVTEAVNESDLNVSVLKDVPVRDRDAHFGFLKFKKLVLDKIRDRKEGGKKTPEFRRGFFSRIFAHAEKQKFNVSRKIQDIIGFGESSSKIEAGLRDDMNRIVDVEVQFRLAHGLFPDGIVENVHKGPDGEILGDIGLLDQLVRDDLDFGIPPASPVARRLFDDFARNLERPGDLPPAEGLSDYVADTIGGMGLFLAEFALLKGAGAAATRGMLGVSELSGLGTLASEMGTAGVVGGITADPGTSLDAAAESAVFIGALKSLAGAGKALGGRLGTSVGIPRVGAAVGAGIGEAAVFAAPDALAGAPLREVAIKTGLGMLFFRLVPVPGKIAGRFFRFVAPRSVAKVFRDFSPVGETDKAVGDILSELVKGNVSKERLEELGKKLSTIDVGELSPGGRSLLQAVVNASEKGAANATKEGVLAEGGVGERPAPTEGREAAEAGRGDRARPGQEVQAKGQEVAKPASVSSPAVEAALRLQEPIHAEANQARVRGQERPVQAQAEARPEEAKPPAEAQAKAVESLNIPNKPITGRNKLPARIIAEAERKAASIEQGRGNAALLAEPELPIRIFRNFAEAGKRGLLPDILKGISSGKAFESLMTNLEYPAANREATIKRLKKSGITPENFQEARKAALSLRHELPAPTTTPAAKTPEKPAVTAERAVTPKPAPPKQAEKPTAKPAKPKRGGSRAVIMAVESAEPTKGRPPADEAERAAPKDFRNAKTFELTYEAPSGDTVTRVYKKVPFETLPEEQKDQLRKFAESRFIDVEKRAPVFEMIRGDRNVPVSEESRTTPEGKKTSTVRIEDLDPKHELHEEAARVADDPGRIIKKLSPSLKAAVDARRAAKEEARLKARAEQKAKREAEAREHERMVRNRNAILDEVKRTKFKQTEVIVTNGDGKKVKLKGPAKDGLAVLNVGHKQYSVTHIKSGLGIGGATRMHELQRDAKAHLVQALKLPIDFTRDAKDLLKQIDKHKLFKDLNSLGRDPFVPIKSLPVEGDRPSAKPPKPKPPVKPLAARIEQVAEGVKKGEVKTKEPTNAKQKAAIPKAKLRQEIVLKGEDLPVQDFEKVARAIFLEQLPGTGQAGVPRVGSARSGLGFIKKFASTVPEFKKNPVFTLKRGVLEFDAGRGGKFRFEPGLIGLDKTTLAEGQKVRIDIRSLKDAKHPKASERPLSRDTAAHIAGIVAKTPEQFIDSLDPKRPEFGMGARFAGKDDRKAYETVHSEAKGRYKRYREDLLNLWQGGVRRSIKAARGPEESTRARLFDWFHRNLVNRNITGSVARTTLEEGLSQESVKGIAAGSLDFVPQMQKDVRNLALLSGSAAQAGKFQEQMRRVMDGLADKSTLSPLQKRYVEKITDAFMPLQERVYKELKDNPEFAKYARETDNIANVVELIGEKIKAGLPHLRSYYHTVDGPDGKAPKNFLDNLIVKADRNKRLVEGLFKEGKGKFFRVIVKPVDEDPKTFTFETETEARRKARELRLDNRDELISVESTDEGFTVTLKPETRPTIYEFFDGDRAAAKFKELVGQLGKKRVKLRSPLDEDMGPNLVEVKDVSEIAFRSYVDQLTLINTWDYFKHVSMTEARDGPTKGYIQLPTDRNLGPLSGKWVQRNTRARIQEMVLTTKNGPLLMLQELTNHWAFAQVVPNPPGWIRNSLGNTLFDFWAGASLVDEPLIALKSRVKAYNGLFRGRKDRTFRLIEGAGKFAVTAQEALRGRGIVVEREGELSRPREKLGDIALMRQLNIQKTIEQPLDERVYVVAKTLENLGNGMSLRRAIEHSDGPVNDNKYLVRAAEELSNPNRSKVLRELGKANLLELSEGEMKPLRALAKKLINPETRKQVFLDFMDEVDRQERQAGKAYNFSDVASKIRIFDVEKARGATDEEALNKVRLVPDYAQLAQATRYAKAAPLFARFLSFTDASIKAVLQTGFEAPHRLLFSMALPLLVTKYTQFKLGLSEDEVQAFYDAKGFGPFMSYAHPLIPWRVNGRWVPRTLNLEYIIPLYNDLRLDTGPGGIGLPMLLSNPVVSVPLELLFNMSLFTGRRIADLDPDTTEAEKAKQRAFHVMMSFVPAPSVLKFGVTAAIQSAMGKSERSMNQVVLKYIFAIDVRDVEVSRKAALRRLKKSEDAEAFKNIMDAYNRWRGSKPVLTPSDFARFMIEERKRGRFEKPPPRKKRTLKTRKELKEEDEAMRRFLNRAKTASP